MPKSNKSKVDVIKEENVLKAVVVADSFDDNFGPLSKTKPKALFPVVTVPLIEYCLELLDSCDVEEVFVLSCYHTESLKKYINSSKWKSSKLTVSVISLDSCLSYGDCLREIDAKGVVRNNFILMNVDSISNVSLQPMLSNLKELVKSDKGCIMNVIMKKSAVSRASPEEEVLVVKNDKTNKIVHYQKMKSVHRLELPVTVLQENESVEVCCNLINTEIAVCTPAVLSLFSDNFDLQTFDNFMKEILINEEILGNSIYLHIVEEEYSSKVSNLIAYTAVSYDVIGRWSYPLVPDFLAPFSYLRNNIYKGRNITLDRRSIIKENVTLGTNTSIGEHTKIVRSVIGRNCKLGANVTIENSFLWDNVIIGDNCHIKNSLISDNVIVKDGCSILLGSVLGCNVIVGPNITLPNGTLLVENEMKDEFDEVSNLEAECDEKLVGTDGRGYLFKFDASSDVDDEDLVRDLWGLNIHPDTDDEDASSVSTDFSIDEPDGRAESPQHEDVKLFKGEVLDSLIRGIEENVKCENLILEINSSKYAYNVTMKEVNMNVTLMILSIPLVKNPDLSAVEYFGKLRQYLSYLLPLVRNYIKSNDSQKDCIMAIENYMIKNENVSDAMMKVLHYLYEEDVLSEDTIMRWFNDECTDDEKREDHQRIKNAVSSFIKWLQEAEEESDSDEDESS